jgi:hypothetical protein
MLLAKTSVRSEELLQTLALYSARSAAQLRDRLSPWLRQHHNRFTCTCPSLADAIGLVLIAVELRLVFWWLLPDDGTRFIARMLAYGILVAPALAMRRSKDAKRFSDT